MQDNGETQGAMTSLNDIISGNQQGPNPGNEKTF